MGKKLISDKLIIEFVEQKNAYRLEMNSAVGDWLDRMEPDSRFLHYIYFNIYGVPVILDDDLEEAYYEEDTSKFTKIGRLAGYYIPFGEITEGGWEPVIICDAVSGDLEFVASVMKDYYEENDSMMFSASLFYIEELEIYKQYRNNGFGSKVLQELPYLLGHYKGFGIYNIAYFPAPTQYDEKELTPYEEALLKQAVYRINECFGGESAISQMRKEKIVSIERKLSVEEINEIIENEKNTPSYKEEYKNTDLFRFYEKNGFREIRQTRLLVKEL